MPLMQSSCRRVTVKWMTHQMEGEKKKKKSFQNSERVVSHPHTHKQRTWNLSFSVLIKTGTSCIFTRLSARHLRRFVENILPVTCKRWRCHIPGHTKCITTVMFIYICMWKSGCLCIVTLCGPRALRVWLHFIYCARSSCPLMITHHLFIYLISESN